MRQRSMTKEVFEKIVKKDYTDREVILLQHGIDEVVCALSEPSFDYWWGRPDIKEDGWECDLKTLGSHVAKYPFNERLEINNANIKESSFWSDTSFRMKFKEPLTCKYKQGLGKMRRLVCSPPGSIPVTVVVKPGDYNKTLREILREIAEAKE